MTGTTDLKNIIFKAKIKIKKCRYTEMEIEAEGSISFLMDFLKETTECFLKSEINN